jgi:hypothetical protein
MKLWQNENNYGPNSILSQVFDHELKYTYYFAPNRSTAIFFEALKITWHTIRSNRTPTNANLISTS